MAHQYGGDQSYDGSGVRRTDEWGNPVGLTDEWGNPVRQTGEYGNPTADHGISGNMGPYANTTAPSGIPVGGSGMAGDSYRPHGVETGREHHGTIGGMLHRSGSSSSSSSEDDGQGGRRKKKGIKEKIKEKLPGSGGHNKGEYDYEPTAGPATGGGYGYGGGGGGEEHHQKKGFMDKIKEKLPGGHH